MSAHRTFPRKLFFISISVLSLIAGSFLLLSHFSKDRDFPSRFKAARQIKSGSHLTLTPYFNTQEKSQHLHPSPPPLILEEIIKSHIDQAKQKIWVAVYSIGIDDLIEALQNAKNRGVDIKLILDDKKKEKFLKIYYEKVKSFDLRFTDEYPSESKDRKNLMHLKTMLVDPDDKDHATILTGTWNWTSLQEKYDPNNLLMIKDYDIAQVYQKELVKLGHDYHGETKSKDPNYNPFALKKEFADGMIELWFSPRTESVAYFERIIELIRQSRKSIYIANLYFTNPKIAAELYKKYKAGIKIKIIADDSHFWEKESVYPNFWGVKNNSKIQAWDPPLRTMATDYFRHSRFRHSYRSPESSPIQISSYLHQHFLIVDEQVVATGSGNWTAGSEWSNDEDGFVIRHQKTVDTFLSYFWHHYTALGGKGPKSELVLEVDKKPFSLRLKNLSSSTQQLNGYQVISTRSQYELNQFKGTPSPEEIQSKDFKPADWIQKNPFDVGVIAQQPLRLKELAAETNSPLLDTALLEKLFPEDERKNPIEVYLLNGRQELIASTRIFPNDFEN